MITKIWCRVGVMVAVELSSENPDREEVRDAVIAKLREHDPGKLDCFFEGDTYIPASDDEDSDGQHEIQLWH